jgi:hypothetical protein
VIVALRPCRLVQRICHASRNNTVAFSMMARDSCKCCREFVPKTGKGDVSGFRKWDEDSVLEPSAFARSKLDEDAERKND